MQIDEFIKIVESQAKMIPESDVYFALKKMKVRYITKSQIQVIRLFIALRKLGFNFVPVDLITLLLNREPNSVRDILHRLGDKHVIVLLRESHRQYRYCLSSQFLQHLPPSLNI